MKKLILIASLFFLINNLFAQVVTDIDSNKYNTITICKQSWMQTNLKASHYRNGDLIPQVTDPNEWSKLTTGAWCYYKNDPANGAIYGKLYNWYAVTDPRGLAPTGWHIPGDAEWTMLSTCLGGNAASVSGGAMKETGTTHWSSPNIGATNSSSFAGLPGGYRFYNGTYNSIGSYGFWWSSTEDYLNYAWSRALYYDGTSIGRDSDSKAAGFSVRCVRD